MTLRATLTLTIPASTEAFLRNLVQSLERISVSQAAATAALDAATAQLTAANARLDKVAVEVATLRDLIEAAGDTVSPELQAAIGRVVAAAGVTSTKVGQVDDLNPDAP